MDDYSLELARHGLGAARPTGDPREEFFFAAVARTLMPMLVTNPRLDDNPIVFANAAFLKMTGYPLDEVVGRNCRFLQGAETDPADVSKIRSAVEEHREISIEIVNYRKGGDKFWNALFISPLVDESGEIVYHFASHLDVSPRRDAEAALAQGQKMEALGQLTGGISHDFNNLLQVMMGHVELLDRRLRREPLDAKAIGAASGSIRSAIEKAATLTQHLLAFARKQRLEDRLANLNDLTEGLMALAEPTLGADIRIVTDLAPELGDCLIDPKQFEVALLNVLINARDAMQGRGTVTIRTSDATIESGDLRALSGIEPGRYAVIAVSDTGSGMPPEIVRRVMEPFFTTKDEGKGTGLGLSMVHGFVKQSGGGTQIDSELGVGTTLQMYFPVSRGRARAADRARRVRERGGQEVLLVVDDRAEVLGVATGLLEELGYHVLTASSGNDALALVEALEPAERPELLFSDVIMPGGMNGYTLARRLRELSPTLKVLLTTGFAGDEETRSSDIEFEVLKKPYQLDDLARRVRGVLDSVPTAD